jgi:hypothetical protein
MSHQDLIHATNCDLLHDFRKRSIWIETRQLGHPVTSTVSTIGSSAADEQTISERISSREPSTKMAKPPMRLH